MKLHMTTCVWGAWHLDVMQRVMLPTLIAAGNLPALAGRHEVRYRISTTPGDRERIRGWPVFGHLQALAPVEFVTDRSDPDITYHVEWYHEAIATARGEGAFCLFLPPDVAWSNGTLASVAALLEAGKLAAAMPFLRVIHETCLPAIAALGATLGEAGGAIEIAPGDLVRLAVGHLHPLSSTVLPGGPHARPSLEVLWRVPDEGLLFRHMVRELFLFDPGRVELTHLWYAGGGCALEDLHLVTDSDEMFMLSFAPFLKDIPIYVPDHSIAPMDLARQSLHPLNDTPFNSELGRHSIRLHYGAMTEWRWRRAESRADAFMKQAIVMREALRIWQAIRDHGCASAAGLLAVALQATRLARRWPADAPLTLFVPHDPAVAALGEPATAWLAGSDSNLVAAALAHAALLEPGPPRDGRTTCRALDGTVLEIGSRDDQAWVNDEVRILESFAVPPHQVHVVDRWLGPFPPEQGA